MTDPGPLAGVRPLRDVQSADGALARRAGLRLLLYRGPAQERRLRRVRASRAGARNQRRAAGLPALQRPAAESDLPRLRRETELVKGETCWRCLLTAMVGDLLADPDGAVPAKLQPLATAICSMPRANSGVTWLRRGSQAVTLLRALASGTVDLTHEALDDLPASRAVEYLRGLLVSSHALPPRDRRLAAFERWLDSKLEGIGHDEHRQIVARFARWHHLRDLRRQAATSPLADGPFLAAKQSVTVTITFLAWLQQRGRTLAGCTQHDIDAWYASGLGTRHKAERFLYWCRTQRLTRVLDIPRHSNDNPVLIGETEPAADHPFPAAA